MSGIYIHVPFCLRKCPYCDFYSVPLDDSLADGYTEAVLRAIETCPFGDIRADTLYLGGGTPVLLGHKRLGRILSAARDAFGIPDTAEITVEANPAAAMKDTFLALRELGVNRISLGVQSLHDSELRALGRPHNAEEARRAVLDAYSAGFDNISADLMLAIPGQTRESMTASIDGLEALPVSHISAYLLSIEEGTPFWAQKNALSLPDEEETAQRYLDCVGRLEGHGFKQYEVSNFARDGKASCHNLNYWRCGEYLGIGPAAHSFIKGKRFYFPRDLDGFLAGSRPFGMTIPDGDGGGPQEEALLRLRLTEGLTLSETAMSGGAADRMLAKARFLAARGLTVVKGDNIALTAQGFLLSNSVIAALLEATDPECS